ncbi:hypothetical protein CLU79DRAFT_836584 [Phycomyces nitens]|nr:hypothetical protein CLU79DRAFT_836584 [Phycomyces nitens]
MTSPQVYGRPPYPTGNGNQHNRITSMLLSPPGFQAPSRPWSDSPAKKLTGRPPYPTGNGNQHNRITSMFLSPPGFQTVALTAVNGSSETLDVLEQAIGIRSPRSSSPADHGVIHQPKNDRSPTLSHWQRKPAQPNHIHVLESTGIPDSWCDKERRISEPTERIMTSLDRRKWELRNS